MCVTQRSPHSNAPDPPRSASRSFSNCRRTRRLVGAPEAFYRSGAANEVVWHVIHLFKEALVSTPLASPAIHPAAESAAAEEILAATAHELRLPLSHIKGFVSSLRRTDVEWDDATRDEFIAHIHLEADPLTHIPQLPLHHT